MGEIVGLQPPKNQIGIGDGQVTVFPVTDRARMGACGLRPHLEHAVFKKETGTAACGHGPDIKLGCLNAHARCSGFKGQFQLTAIAGDIGGGAAHVKPDHRTPGFPVKGRQTIADHAARRSGENGAAAGKVIGRGQAAVRLHKEKVGTGQPIDKPLLKS